MALPVPSFTIEMLDDLPDDGNRYELLEGMLLVTPAPNTAHQIVVSRIHTRLSIGVQESGLAHVVAPGAIQRGRRTQLLPDILVFPARFPPTTHWRRIGDWWLAVEVVSPSSRVYDRDVKRPAYLALGVAEYWIVDPRECVADIWRPGESKARRVTDEIRWHPPVPGREISIDLRSVFRDIRAGDDDETE